MNYSDSTFTSVATFIDRVIVGVATLVALGSLLVLFLALGLEVIVRYVTNSGLGWTTELPNLLFPWLIMGGIVLAAQRGQHIAVTAILSVLSKSATRVLFIFLQLLLVVTFCYLSYMGLEVIEVTGSEHYPYTGLSAKWAYLALIAGFVGIALTSLTTLVWLFVVDDPLEVRAHVLEDDV